MGESLGEATSDKTVMTLNFSAATEVKRLESMLEELSVSVLSLIAGEINFFVAKTVNESSFVILGGDFNKDGSRKCASSKKCFDLDLVDSLERSLFVKISMWTNSRGIAKALDYILISLSLVNAVTDGSVADVEEYFDTDHKAVSAFVDLGGLLDVHLNLICKQVNKDCWKFDVKSADVMKWGEFKNATAANATMFLDEFKAARKFSDLDAMWDTVHKVMVFSANSAFKKKWFKSYDGMFTKESFKLHNLEVLVSKIVKTSCEADSNRFESLLKCWVFMNSDKASVVCNLMSSGVNFDHVHSALCGMRRYYHASKLAESLRAKKLGIKSAIERKMESFMVNKGHTIYSVLEHPFHKVVLDHLVSDGSLILDPVEVKNKIDSIMEGWTRKRAVLKSVPDLWQYQYLLLDYVDNNAFSGVMNAISLDDLTHVIKDLPDGKAADLSGISNKLWKHCDGFVLDLLLDLRNICLVYKSTSHCWKEAWVSIIPKLYKPIALIETAYKILFKLLSDRISSVCSLFNVLHGNNFSSPIFAIGSVVENALEKDYMHKAYNSVGWHHLHNSLVWIKMCRCFIRFFGLIYNDHINQSEVFSLLLWKIFYDSLLCEIKRQKSLCVRSSQIATQYILNIRVSNASLLISGLPILIACRKESHQYLGIYLSSKRLSKLSLAKAHIDVKFFVNLVLKKAILDKQFLYLILAVLQPIISYRTQFSFVSRNVCMKWDTLIRRRLRLKAGLPRDFSNETLHHLFLYGLRFFEQLQTECKVASVLCFSNTDSILGCLFNHKSLDLQVLGWSPIHPLHCPIRLCVSPVNNFLAGVIRIFLDCGMSLGNLSTPISAVLGAFLFYDVSLFLRKFGVTFAEQLYTKKGLIFDWKSFHHWKRLDPRSPVPHWFTLICDFLDQSSTSDDLCIEGSWDIDVCSLGAVSELSHCLSSANMKVVNVYTDGSLRNLGSHEMNCGAAAYFLDLDMSIGAKIGGLVSSTIVKLQVIALALECIPPNSFVVVYSDSQAALDVCVAESALVSSDFHNHCWMEQHGIVNLIRKKQFVVSWHKVKRHSGIVGNECADKLAGLAVSSSLVLFVLVRERFIMATGEAEVGPGFNVVNDSLLGDVDWFCTASVWHSDSHMAASFTSKSTADLHSYFLKALYHCLPVAVQKRLYSKVYPNILCLYCGEVESSDHSFVCTFDSDAHKSILKSYLAKWQSVSGLGLHSSRVSQVLFLCTFDDMLYTTMGKGFVFRDWVQEASSILDDTKVAGRFIVDFIRELGAAYHLDIWVVRAKYRALIEKGGLILFDSSVYPVTHGLSCMFSAGVIRLLGISEVVGMGQDQLLTVLPNVESSGRLLPVLEAKQLFSVVLPVSENWADQMKTESSLFLVSSAAASGA
ncbi:hypothetical protein G9A89_007354 [Geosiphon pyriformis]|nr:hypothetical protein G9A89_007354 [Geosiphon pyriformis]